MELGMGLDLVTLCAVSLGGVLVSLARAGLEARVKASAEAGVVEAVKSANWTNELARELERTRGTERQELRFKSYGLLWAKLRPLAIYDSTDLDRKAAIDLGNVLTEWYFSPDGGLMLTGSVRDFFFALQDLLAAIGRTDDWHAKRTDGALEIFKTVSANRNLKAAADVLNYFGEGPTTASSVWPKDSKSLAKAWGDCLNALGSAWLDLEPPQRFAVLQQAGSVLRSAMTCDVESRVR